MFDKDKIKAVAVKVNSDDRLVKKYFWLSLIVIFLVFRAVANFSPIEHKVNHAKKLALQNYELLSKQMLLANAKYLVPEATLMAAQGGFTWQLYSSNDLDSVQYVVRKQHLKADRVAYFREDAKRGLKYTLVYGHYHNLKEAKYSLRSLPQAVQNLHPALRSLDSVHTAILHHHV